MEFVYKRVDARIYLRKYRTITGNLYNIVSKLEFIYETTQPKTGTGL